PSPANTGTRVTRYRRAPDTASSGGINFQIINSPGTTVGEIRIRNPFVGKQAASVMIEDGAVSADKVNAESVAGAVGQFLEIEAGQLVAGDATIDEAVINRLWTDGIAARTIDVNKLTVASRNMWPDPGLKDAGAYEDDGWEVVDRDGELGIERYGDSALRGGYGHDDPLYFMPVVYGEWYDISAHLDYLEGSTGDTYIRARSYTASGSYVGGSTYSPVRGTPSDDGKTVSGDWTPYSRDTEYLIIGFFTESNMPDTTRVRWTDFRVRPKVGTVLIEDGAITTPKLTVTEDMSAAIVNAMSVNTKKLVVTEEAILNHATLIGQTVVDDINVQGKLI